MRYSGKWSFYPRLAHPWSAEQSQAILRSLQRESHADIRSVVHIVRCVVAARVAGADLLPDCLANTASFPHRRGGGGRRPVADFGYHYAARARNPCHRLICSRYAFITLRRA